MIVTIDTMRIARLPWRYRVLANMLSVCMLLFDRDTRFTALILVLERELDVAAHSDQDYDTLADIVSDTMKLDRRAS